MSKKNKLTAASIAKAMRLAEEEALTITLGADEDTVEISVKPSLSITDRIAIVDDIVDMVFIDRGNGVQYLPTLKRFAIEYNIVSYFTDIKLPSDSNKAHKFLERSDIVSKIEKLLPYDYLGDIIADACEAIEYRAQELLKRSKFDDCIDRIIDVIKALNLKINDIDISEIVDFVNKNAPEFKGQLEQLITSQSVASAI